MIPASILLILLVAADAISHIALWMRGVHFDERAQDAVKEMVHRELDEHAKGADYSREIADLKHEVRKLRMWSKMPEDFKF